MATLELNDVYAWPKLKYLRSVYLTERVDHPGADMVLRGDADKSHLIGGEIRVLPQPKNPAFGKYVLTPREVRRLLAERGWNAVVAFQTRNPCTGPTNMPSCTGSKHCCVKATTPEPA